MKGKKMNYLVVVLDTIYMAVFALMWSTEKPPEFMSDFMVVFLIFAEWIVGILNIICGIINRKNKSLALWQMVFGFYCILFGIELFGGLNRLSWDIHEFYYENIYLKNLPNYIMEFRPSTGDDTWEVNEVLKIETGILITFLGIIPSIIAILNIIIRRKEKNKIISKVSIVVISIIYLIFLIKYLGSYQISDVGVYTSINEYTWCVCLPLWNIMSIIMQYKYIKNQSEE